MPVMCANGLNTHRETITILYVQVGVETKGEMYKLAHEDEDEEQAPSAVRDVAHDLRVQSCRVILRMRERLQRCQHMYLSRTKKLVQGRNGHRAKGNLPSLFFLPHFLNNND